MSTRSLHLGLALLLACGSSKPQVTVPAPVPTARDVVVATPPPARVDPDAAPIPLWPEVKKGTLPNGLTYYIFKHGKPEKRALLWLAVNAGSVQEDDDQRGLAHFDEHMAFNGTKRYPKNVLISYLEKIGMRFGADLNAYTTWDQTVYQLEVPTDDAQYIAGGLDILRDWAADVTYDPSEVGVAGKGDKERGVVLEEWRLGRGAGRRLYDKQAKVLFAGTRYADRLAIGDPDIIKNAPRDNLPVLQGLVSAGPDGGDRGRRLRSGGHRKADRGAVLGPESAREGATAADRRVSEGRGDPRFDRDRQRGELDLGDRREPRAASRRR